MALIILSSFTVVFYASSWLTYNWYTELYEGCDDSLSMAYFIISVDSSDNI